MKSQTEGMLQRAPPVRHDVTWHGNWGHGGSSSSSCSVKVLLGGICLSTEVYLAVVLFCLCLSSSFIRLSSLSISCLLLSVVCRHRKLQLTQNSPHR